MNKLHALLARQVKRQFGSLENLTAECRAFVHDVDEAYRELESDRGMLERALEISSEEQMQANAQMRALLEAFPDIYFRLDAHGRILEHKAGLAADTSLRSPNLVGKLIQAVLLPEVARKFQTAIEQVGLTQSLVAIEYSLSAHAVEECYEARLLPLSGKEIFVIVRDITRRREVEDRLRRSEERLQEAVQVSSIGMFEQNHLTDTVYWSPELRKNYGWSLDELVTLEKYLQFVHPADSQRIVRAIRHAHDPAGSGRFDLEHRIIRRDGNVRWLVTRAQSFFEGEGAARRLVRTTGAVLDITEQKLVEEKLARARDELEVKVQERTWQLRQANDSLRESEERARSILNNVQAGIVVVDFASHKVLEANPVALSLLKRSREEVIGHACHNCICLVDRSRCPVANPDQMVENAERVLLRADGTSIPILKTVVPVTLGGRQVLLESFVDITERKRAQAELEQAKLAAEVASEAKSRFLATMSHEIRTPLNGVTGVLHLLQKDKLSAKQHRWIEIATTSAGTLLRVINDILDFSKVEAGKLDLHMAPTDLHATVNKTAATFIERVVAKGLAWNLSIDSSVPRCVAADRDRLAQVLGNLLGNAIKFTDAGSISLRVTLQAQVADVASVRFEVIDTGAGVGPEQLERLFKPFSQVDSSMTRRHGGTGLGLGICKQLVELMGGTIGVESETGKGSTFWFELPLRKTTPLSKPEAVAPLVGGDAVPAGTAISSPPSAPKRILLAEDNEINQELVREIIQCSGCECECDCVADGYEAVNAAIHGGYDLMFMDCMMPGMDGYAAAQAIRAEEARQAAPGQRVRRLPIIAMTANAMEGDREECLAAGMDDYLSKPLDPEKVVKAIQQWSFTGRQEVLLGRIENKTAAPGAINATTTGAGPAMNST